MSGIYIKDNGNVYMPKSCSECQEGFLPIVADCPWSCWNTPSKYGEVFLDPKLVRHPECVLVEVRTPHGRLIDSDDITNLFSEYDGVLNWEYIAPTVIESEE